MGHTIPEARGFSETNLRYMKRFFELFSEGSFSIRTSSGSARQILPQVGEESRASELGEILPQVVAESPAGGKRAADLPSFIPWGHIRLLIDKCWGDLAQETVKDHYNFDFLAIRERHDERELKDALMDSITRSRRDQKAA